MLLAREQLGAAVFASRDESRPVLTQLKVDPDGTVWATNGHVLVKVTRQAQKSDVDFPLARFYLPDSLKTTFKDPVLIPRATAIAVARILPNKPRLPILGYVCLAVSPEAYYLCSTDMERQNVEKVERPPNDQKFLDVQSALARAIAAKPSGEPVRISAMYLSMIGQYAKTFAKEPVCVKVTPHGPLQPVEFSWEDVNSGLAVHGLLAPTQSL